MRLFDIWHDLKDMVRGTALPDAIDAVAPLLAEFGVRFQVVNWRLVQGRSEHVRLDIERDPVGMVLVWIAPLNYKESHVEHDKTLQVARNIGLSAVLQVLAPDVQFEPKYVRSYKNIREEVERQVRLLIEYCRPILEGDFSTWPLIVESTKH